jgi:hypothetical protein
MNRNKREQAVQVFMAKDKARVMLMSLKCGGVGLNLTRANNVISLDLGWSPAIDQQVVGPHTCFDPVLIFFEGVRSRPPPRTAPPGDCEAHGH